MKLIIDISEELYAKVPYLINKGSVLIRDVLDAVEKGTPLEAQPTDECEENGSPWCLGHCPYNTDVQPTDAVDKRSLDSVIDTLQTWIRTADDEYDREEYWRVQGLREALHEIKKIKTIHPCEDAMSSDGR